MNPWCRPVAEAKRERPTLVLLLGCGQEDSVALAVGAGCEEEGIPLVWERSEGGADELSREAAGRSRLEVGIGVDGSSGAVTFAKYPSPKAYLRIELDDTHAARWLGQAAARFVKRKPIPERFEEPGKAPVSEHPVPGEWQGEPEEIPVPQVAEAEPERAGFTAEPAKDSVDEISEAAVDRITKAVLEALRRQR